MRRMMIMFVLAALLAGCVGGNLPDSVHSLASLPQSVVQVDDDPFAYRIFGEGPPLLMIMGFAGTMDIWDTKFVRELAKEHTVIIFDNRGIGGSGKGTEEISITGMAADSAALLRELGYPHADVLGWSMGGLIAQELALNYPEKVNKLVLIGTSCDAQPVVATTHRLMKMDVPELLSHFFPSGWVEKYPEAFEKLPRPASPPDQKIIQSQAAAMLRWSGCCSRLTGFDKPILVISGLDDDILPESLGVEITKHVKGSWLVRYKNATHWLMYQDPVGLGENINNFLAVKQDLLSQ